MVVDFNDDPGWIVTVLVQDNFPRGETTMTVTVAGTEFEHHDYDARADVLYLTAEGYPGPPANAYASPEGHGIEYDDAGKIVAMTLVNIRSLLDRDGELTITWPAGLVGAGDLAAVLVPAA